ncbi:MAG TPA: hypothetical protein VGN53_02700 [Klebsiella sp.]
MRELTAIEIDSVSGAGWLQDGLASVGSTIGDSAWSLSIKAIGSISLPIIGSIDLSTIAPDLGKTVGNALGTALGFTIEGALASIPVVGGLLNKILGN